MQTPSEPQSESFNFGTLLFSLKFIFLLFLFCILWAYPKLILSLSGWGSRRKKLKVKEIKILQNLTSISIYIVYITYYYIRMLHEYKIFVQ
jgi:hypothetical protein